MGVTQFFGRVRADPLFRFQAAFVAMLAGGLLIWKTPVWGLTFYLLVVPCLALALHRDRKLLGSIPPPATLAYAMFLYSALTVLWGANDVSITKVLSNAAATALFFTAGLVYFRTGADARDKLFDALTLAAVANALLSIVLFFLFSEEWRLSGFAQTRHSILGALVMGVCILITIHRVIADDSPRRNRVRAICLALQVIFLLMCASRGPILTLMAAVLVFLAFGYRKAIVLIGVAIACFAAAVLIAMTYEPFYGQITWYFSRPSLRLEIWSFTLELWAARPWLGYGMAARFVAPEIGTTATFPHSLYFSALYYGGLVALALLLGFLVSLGTHVVRRWNPRHGPFCAALLVHICFSGLTDLSRTISGASELWYILWLPVCIILGMKDAADKPTSRT